MPSRESWTHVLKFLARILRRCSDVFKEQRYFHGNKERSEKSLLLVFLST